jgi:hypothetical protein
VEQRSLDGTLSRTCIHPSNRTHGLGKNRM